MRASSDAAWNWLAVAFALSPVVWLGLLGVGIGPAVVEGWLLQPSHQHLHHTRLHLPQKHQKEFKSVVYRRQSRILQSQSTSSSSVSTSSSSHAPLPPTNVQLPDTSKPIPAHTFGGMVEQRMIEKFGPQDQIERIIQSWRLLDQDYYHKQYVGDDEKNDVVLPEDPPTRPSMIQECHSYVPGLSIRPFWDKSQFKWTKYLEDRYKDIRQEFDTVTQNLSQLKSQGNNIWAGALTDDASSYGVGWKTLVLMDRGRWDPVNTKLFPVTARAVYESGVPATEVFFASMAPNTDIKTHTDFTNFVLTSHLALDIPCSGENKCRLTIGNETRQWINGEVMVFDTSLLHDAINESDDTRYILMMRLWHPDLSSVEQQALQFTFDALEVDGLVSDDPGQRYVAEQTVESVRTFPLLLDDDDNNSKTKGGGFEINKGSTSSSSSSSKKKKNKKTTKSASKGFGR
jgi:aspartyl/asparaginyl beta-hydroxylase (cupin superfamily)